MDTKDDNILTAEFIIDAYSSALKVYMTIPSNIHQVAAITATESYCNALAYKTIKMMNRTQLDEARDRMYRYEKFLKNDDPKLSQLTRGNDITTDDAASIFRVQVNGMNIGFDSGAKYSIKANSAPTYGMKDYQRTSSENIYSVYSKIQTLNRTKDDRVPGTVPLTDLDIKFMDEIIKTSGITDETSPQSLDTYMAMISKIVFCSSEAAIRCKTTAKFLNRLQNTDLTTIHTIPVEATALKTCVDDASRVIRAAVNTGHQSKIEKLAVEFLNKDYLQEFNGFRFFGNTKAIYCNGSVYTPDIIGLSEVKNEAIGIEIKEHKDISNSKASYPIARQITNGMNATGLSAIHVVEAVLKNTWRDENNQDHHVPSSSTFIEVYQAVYPDDFKLMITMHGKQNTDNELFHLENAEKYLKKSLLKKDAFCSCRVVHSIYSPLTTEHQATIRSFHEGNRDIQRVMHYFGKYGICSLTPHTSQAKEFSKLFTGMYLLPHPAFRVGTTEELGFTPESSNNMVKLLKTSFWLSYDIKLGSSNPEFRSNTTAIDNMKRNLQNINNFLVEAMRKPSLLLNATFSAYFKTLSISHSNGNEDEMKSDEFPIHEVSEQTSAIELHSRQELRDKESAMKSPMSKPANTGKLLLHVDTDTLFDRKSKKLRLIHNVTHENELMLNIKESTPPRDRNHEKNSDSRYEDLSSESLQSIPTKKIVTLDPLYSLRDRKRIKAMNVERKANL